MKSRLRKSAPRTGSFDMPGYPETACLTSSLTNPAIIIEPPEGSSTVVSARRFRIEIKLRSTALADPSIVGSETEVISDREVRGYCRVRGGWNDGKAYTVYFHAVFDQPFAEFTTWAGEKFYPGEKKQVNGAKKTGVLLTVNFSFRYLPRLLKAKELIDAGAIGEIAGMHIMWQMFKDRGYWAGAQSNSPDDWRACVQLF